MLKQLALATVATFALVVASGGAADAASKCSGNKIKAAGKKAGSKLTCLSKGLSKALTPDSTCIAKAEVKFSTVVAKAEAKTYTDGGCLTSGDASTIEGKVDTLYSDIDALVADNNGGTANPCDAQKTKAAGKKVAAKLTCHSKAVTKGLLGPDSTCLAKAEVKFSTAMAKAEAKVPPPCTATGDAGTYESTIDSAVNDIATELNQTTTTSTTTTTTTSTTTTTCPTVNVPGALTPTKGQFNYNLTLGIPGANAACNTNFAGSHVCTYNELLCAGPSELTGLQDTAAATVTVLWAIDPTAGALTQCFDDQNFTLPTHPAHDWEYGTAHTGSRGNFVNLTNGTGVLGPLQMGAACAIGGTTRWVACCQ